MRRVLRLVIFLVPAWAAGVAAYFFALYGISIGAPPLSSELYAVLLWPAAALLIATPLVYLPVLLGLRRLVGSDEPVIFSLVAAFLGIVPTALIVFAWSGGLRGLLSEEAGLFCCLFGVFGLIIGAAFAWPARD